MIIVDQPTLDLVAIRAHIPSSMKFVLDKTGLGQTPTLGGGPLDYFWQDILPDAVEDVTINRGVDPETRGATPGTLTMRIKATLTGMSYLKPGVKIQAYERSTNTVFFTGKIRSISSETLGKPIQTTFVMITATDVVADIANTPRSGAASGYGEWETAGNRADRYALTALQAGVNLTHSLPKTPAFNQIETVFSGPASTLAQAQAELTNNWTYLGGTMPDVGALTGGGYGLRFGGWSRMARTFRDLIPGKSYLVAVGPLTSKSMNLNVDWITIDNNPVAVDPSMYGTPVAFIAHASTVTITWQVSETLWVEAIGLWTMSDSWRPAPQADTIFDSNLASHLDRLVASAYADAYWIVNQAGEAEIKRGPALSAATLTVSDDANPSFIDMVETSNTSDTVSSVKMLIARRTFTDTGWVEETQADTLTDVTIAATFGGRALEVETSCASLPILQNIAAELLTAPVSTPRQISLNLTRSPEMIQALDLLTPIKIRSNYVTRPARIIGITHTITPTRWMVSLALTGK